MNTESSMYHLVPHKIKENPFLGGKQNTPHKTEKQFSPSDTEAFLKYRVNIPSIAGTKPVYHAYVIFYLNPITLFHCKAVVVRDEFP